MKDFWRVAAPLSKGCESVFLHGQDADKLEKTVISVTQKTVLDTAVFNQDPGRL